MANKFIYELPQLFTLSNALKLPAYDAQTNTTYHFDLGLLGIGGNPADFLWDSETVFAEGAIVTWSQGPGQPLQVWVSESAGNQGNVPGPDSTFWSPGTSQRSGIVPWQAGVYMDDYPSVVHNNILYWLDLSVPRPYNSTDIDAEIIAGDWIPLNGGGGGALVDGNGLVFDTDHYNIGGLLTQNTTIKGGDGTLYSLSFGDLGTAAGLLSLSFEVNGGIDLITQVQNDSIINVLGNAANLSARGNGDLPGLMKLTAQDPDTTDIVSIHLSGSDFKVYDNRDTYGGTYGVSRGLEYAADYSTNYTSRSLVDKAYVDSVSGGGGVSFGTAGQMPFTNATADDFDYVSGIYWDSATSKLFLGDLDTVAAAPDEVHIHAHTAIELKRDDVTTQSIIMLTGGGQAVMQGIDVTTSVYSQFYAGLGMCQTTAIDPVDGTTTLEVGNGYASIDKPFHLPSYSKALLPTPIISGGGAMVYVTDDVGGAVPAFYDGADWRRVTDRAVIS